MPIPLPFVTDVPFSLSGPMTARVLEVSKSLRPCGASSFGRFDFCHSLGASSDDCCETAVNPAMRDVLVSKSANAFLRAARGLDHEKLAASSSTWVVLMWAQGSCATGSTG